MIASWISHCKVTSEFAFSVFPKRLLPLCWNVNLSFASMPFPYPTNQQLFRQYRGNSLYMPKIRFYKQCCRKRQMTVDMDSVPRISKQFISRCDWPKHPARISHGNYSGRNILCNYTSCPDDRTVTDMDSRHYDYITAQPDTATDMYGRIHAEALRPFLRVESMVDGVKAAIRTNQCMVSDADSCVVHQRAIEIDGHMVFKEDVFTVLATEFGHYKDTFSAFAKKFFQYLAAKILFFFASLVISHAKAARPLKFLHHRLVEDIGGWKVVLSHIHINKNITKPDCRGSVMQR